MSCMREETFGPTLPVMKVKDVEEAIRFANDSSYGLSASVWTRDRARGEQIAARLEVGAVNVNDMFVNVFSIQIPQGGSKESGVGARLVAPTGFASTAARSRSPRRGSPPGRSCSGTRIPPSRASSTCASLASCSHETGAAAWGGAGAKTAARDEIVRYP